MFIAKLMICGMLQGGCTLLTDTSGLHRTEEQCRARIEEMMSDLHDMVPHMRMAADCQRMGVPV